MAKIKTPLVEPPLLAPTTGLKFLQKQLNRAEELTKDDSLSETDFETWRHLTTQYIKETFGSEHDNVYFFSGRGEPSHSVSDLYGRPPSISAEIVERHEHLREKIAALKTIIEQLDERLQIEATATPELQSPKKANQPAGDSVFIVHGHDSGLKEATARLIQKLGLKPVILHEQPDGGRTIVEKLEQHASNASFAVVLLTGDDVGRSKAASDAEVRPRARQNVILELGMFVGLLTRKRVRIIYEDGVELPSDVLGVLFTKYDSEGLWKFGLGKELKAAGFPISLDSIE